MSIAFNKEELEEIKLMAELSRGGSIAETKMTYGENIENLIRNPAVRNKFNAEVFQDYIKQLKLEKQFYWTCGVDEMPLVDKLVLFLEAIIIENNKYQKWIKISNDISENPSARIQCPECNEGNVKFIDVQDPNNSGKLERTIYCTICKHRVQILMNH